MLNFQIIIHKLSADVGVVAINIFIIILLLS